MSIEARNLIDAILDYMEKTKLTPVARSKLTHIISVIKRIEGA